MCAIRYVCAVRSIDTVPYCQQTFCLRFLTETTLPEFRGGTLLKTGRGRNTILSASIQKLKKASEQIGIEGSALILL